jgi:hypothetical protein
MRSLAAVVVLCAVASADPAPPPSTLRVEIGKTVERQVGVLRGYFCDDPSLVTAELVTRGDVNVWIVTGAKIGTTLCRVGDQFHPALLFDVTVVAAKGP